MIEANIHRVEKKNDIFINIHYYSYRIVIIILMRNRQL